MTLQEWVLAMKDRIKVKLGHGVVCVELTDDQVTSAIDEAVAWFGSHIRRGSTKAHQFTPVAGQTMYAVPDDCFLPVRVYSTSRQSDVAYGSMEWVHPDMMWPARGGMGLSEIVQHRQYNALGTRVLGADFKFAWVPESRQIAIDRTLSSDTTAIMEYLSRDFNPEQLTPNDEGLIFKWAFAEAQETLGNIRSKYSELQGGGGSYSLNGQDLLSAAEMAKSTLDEKIKKQIPPPHIQRG